MFVPPKMFDIVELPFSIMEHWLEREEKRLLCHLVSFCFDMIKDISLGEAGVHGLKYKGSNCAGRSAKMSII